MSSNKGDPLGPRKGAPDKAFTSVKRSDLSVWRYLANIAQAGDTCTASIPSIAGACNISQRQVQISLGRLINSGVIKRIGYDLGNPDRAKRGTVFRILKRVA